MGTPQASNLIDQWRSIDNKAINTFSITTKCPFSSSERTFVCAQLEEVSMESYSLILTTHNYNYKHEYYCSGTSPVEFRGHLRPKSHVEH